MPEQIHAELFSRRQRIHSLYALHLTCRHNLYCIRLLLIKKCELYRAGVVKAAESIIHKNVQRPFFRLVGLILWISFAMANVLVLANTPNISEKPGLDVDAIKKPEVTPPALYVPTKRTRGNYLKIPSIPEQPPSQKNPEIQYYFRIVDRAATIYLVDPDLILAMVMVESRYKPLAGSRKSAKGLMQLMPGTAKEMGVLNIFNPEENILAGVKYFRQQLNRFGGDVELALAAYNAGFRKVRIYKGVPPYKETRDYIDDVFNYYQYFKIKKFLVEGTKKKRHFE
jgi:hypothetical protein